MTTAASPAREAACANATVIVDLVELLQPFGLTELNVACF
jgi:hypothetical protein